jgi:hypothetical protein
MPAADRDLAGQAGDPDGAGAGAAHPDRQT